MHRIHNTESPHFSPGQILPPILGREGSSQCPAMVCCLSTHLLFFPIMSLEGGLPPVNPLVSSSISQGGGERGHDVLCWWLDLKPQQALPLCVDAIYANYFQLLLYQSPKLSSPALEWEFPCRSWGAWSQGGRSDCCCCSAVNSWV